MMLVSGVSALRKNNFFYLYLKPMYGAENEQVGRSRRRGCIIMATMNIQITSSLFVTIIHTVDVQLRERKKTTKHFIQLCLRIRLLVSCSNEVLFEEWHLIFNKHFILLRRTRRKSRVILGEDVTHYTDSNWRPDLNSNWSKQTNKQTINKYMIK